VARRSAPLQEDEPTVVIHALDPLGQPGEVERVDDHACSHSRFTLARLRRPQLAGEPIDLRLAREGEREPVCRTRRGAMHEHLVAVELLGNLGLGHRADDERPGRLVGVVLELVRAARADRVGDDVAGLELAESVERPQRRPPRDHDDHLLVAVVEMERRAVVARIDLVQRRAEALCTGLRTNASGSPDQRRLGTLDPLRLEDVRHAVNVAVDSARDPNI
jgi:hypothetical protein